MIISQELKDFFEQVPIMALATVDINAVPNVVAIASKKIIDDNIIYTIDTFHDKTIENIKQNPKVSIALWKNSEGYQIKGTAKYYSSGKIFDTAKAWIISLKPRKIVKGVIEIKIDSIFYLTPNYELAGKLFEYTG